MKKLVSILLLAAMMLMLTACSSGDEWESMLKIANTMENTVEDAQVREYTQQMLDAVLADDYAGAYSLVSDTITDTEFRQAYAEICNVLEGVGAYMLTPSYKKVNTTNGVSSTGVRYMLTSGEKRIFVEAVCTQGYEGLTGFYVYEYTPVTKTGTLASMKGANAAQWILLVVGVLEMAFVLWMFIDCCCHKMKRKWLWLLITGLGAVAWSMTVQNGFRINMNVGLFFNVYTALIRYSTGGFTLRIMVPAGAVVYAAIRKKLFRNYNNSLQPPVPQPPVQWAPTPESATEPEAAIMDEEPQADAE